MSNSGLQFGTDVERKVVTSNPNLFRIGMMFQNVNGTILYSYGNPRQAIEVQVQ